MPVDDGAVENTAWTDAPDSDNDGSLADERDVTVTGLTSTRRNTRSKYRR